ncbi:hypothetical protein Ae201684P_022405 [Aphanomyces euteiches]|nr:hypothetical protein Ae201684P_022405 [Aphanomyces euteiches]KAH9145424.1 hypothetical protein AeRB84_010684 [Aphanomyces euteiches]
MERAETICADDTGDKIIDGRIASSTRKQYEDIAKQMLKWPLKENPDTSRDGKLMLPLTYDACKKFLAYMTVKRDRSGKAYEPTQFESFAAINKCISAIAYLYDKHNMAISHDIKKLFKQFSSGYKRKVARLKQEGELPMGDGKAAVSWKGYEMVCKHAFSGDMKHSSSLAFHPFVTFCWNLMARSVSTASLQFEHITWKGDALLVQFCLTKSDQEGNFCFPKHIYADPIKPEMFPILSDSGVLGMLST